MADHKRPQPRLWGTLEEYQSDPLLADRREQEFFVKPEDADREDAQPSVFEVGRREFLKLTGFAAVFAAVGCGERPVQKILPYVNSPEEVVPGIPNYYSTTCGGCEAGCGLVARSREGRPVKLDGNPEHPMNQGTTCARGQAHLVDLYDPDRARIPFAVSDPSTKIEWATAYGAIAAALKGNGNRAVYLTSTVHSPSHRALIADLQKEFPGLRHVEYDALAEDDRLDAQKDCYGERVMPRYRFDKADVLVLLGADPISEGHSAVEFARHIGMQRRVRHAAGNHADAKMSRIYAIEPVMTVSGMKADYRYKASPDQVYAAALAIAMELGGRSDVAAAGLSLGGAVGSAADLEKQSGLPAGTVKKIADDLLAAKGRSLVYAGGLMTRTADSRRLQVVVNLINTLCGNEGQTVDGTASPSRQRHGSLAEMLRLIRDMKDGKVGVLLIDGPNPAYALPAKAGFAEAMARVPLRISFSQRLDETAKLCTHLLPGTHTLESWGDAEPQAGLISVIQPIINPLWDNRSSQDSLIGIAKAAGSTRFDGEAPAPPPAVSGQPTPTPAPKPLMTYHDYVRATWKRDVFEKGDIAGTFNDFWTSLLRQGFFETAARRGAKATARPFRAEALASVRPPAKAEGPLQLVTYTPAMQYDGRQSNNPYLFEAPDPVSKNTWDNYVALSPATGQKMGLANGDVVALEANGAKVTAPVYLLPGTHPGVAALAGGWGRTAVGEVGNGVGANAYQLAAVSEGTLLHSGGAAKLTKTGEVHKLANTQFTNTPFMTTMADRPIVQHTVLSEYRKDPAAGIEVAHGLDPHNLPHIWGSKHEYNHIKWGMVIDLNACVYCNACTVACQLENNVPVVGRREVLRGREMHWIRIDRYFTGSPEDPEPQPMPMLCQHCDNAPCETVCPVLATTHNDEGLNIQVYNRCVGTRYCSNNCPYKVRRYNWYQYRDFRSGPHINTSISSPVQDGLTTKGPLQLMFNPDVTGRTRGIMEKCNFCQHKLREAKELAKSEGRPVKDGDARTACQAACPSNAIVFGNLVDAGSEVARLTASERGYKVLNNELNTQPAVTYLTIVRNREAREGEEAPAHGKEGGKAAKHAGTDGVAAGREKS